MQNTCKIIHDTPISKQLKREFKNYREINKYVTYGGWLRDNFDCEVKIISTSPTWLHDYMLTFKDYKQKLMFEIKYAEYM